MIARNFIDSPIDTDDVLKGDAEAEELLRAVLAYARAQRAKNFSEDPIRGRAMALIAVEIEDALRTLKLPVP